MNNATGILTFTNNVFKAGKKEGSSGDPKFSIGMLFAPDDPQVAELQAMIDECKANTFPSGYPRKADTPCFAEYDIKVDPNASYYDPRFSGWYMLTLNAKENQKPEVVDGDLETLMDKKLARAGMNGTVAFGMGGYIQGSGGVAGYFNGLMCQGEMGEMGDLTGRPSVKQMFAGAAKTPAAKPSLKKASPVMTDKAEGTYEEYIEGGYTDQDLLDESLMEAPKAVTKPKLVLKPKLKPKLAKKVENVMTSMAEGTYEDYIEAGFTREDMIAEGFLVG